MAAFANDNIISFEGEVVRLLPRGSRQVRLDNGHVLTVLAATKPRLGTILVGDVVRVELGIDEMEGWRFPPSLRTVQEGCVSDARI